MRVTSKGLKTAKKVVVMDITMTIVARTITTMKPAIEKAMMKAMTMAIERAIMFTKMNKKKYLKKDSNTMTMIINLRWSACKKIEQ